MLLTGSVPNPIDVQVGRRLRAQRVLLGLSQEKLGDAVGLTFQQVQKYERGANRISASRLYELARALNIPVSYFFAELGESNEPFAQHDEVIEEDPTRQREVLEFVAAYLRIADLKTRRGLFELTKSIAGDMF